MKKKGWPLALGSIVLLVCVVVYFTTSKNNHVNSALSPQLSVAAVSIKDIGNKEIKMDTRININNPLPIELKTRRLDYQVLVDGKKIVESSYEKPITIKSAGTSSITMPMEILIKPLANVLETFEKRNSDSADYTLRADLQLDLPVKGETEFHFNETKRLPSFRLIKMEAKNVNVDELKLKESKMNFDVSMENPNVFPIKMKDTKYVLTVAKDFVMKGKIEGFTNIPAKSSVTVPVEVEIENKNMLKLVSKTFFKDEETTFNVDMTCDLVSDSKLLHGGRMAVRTHGTLKELKQAIKNTKAAVN